MDNRDRLIGRRQRDQNSESFTPDPSPAEAGFRMTQILRKGRPHRYVKSLGSNFKLGLGSTFGIQGKGLGQIQNLLPDPAEYRRFRAVM